MVKGKVVRKGYQFMMNNNEQFVDIAVVFKVVLIGLNLGNGSPDSDCHNLSYQLYHTIQTV